VSLTGNPPVFDRDRIAGESKAHDRYAAWGPFARGVGNESVHRIGVFRQIAERAALETIEQNVI
jgi:rubrerythrin